MGAPPLLIIVEKSRGTVRGPRGNSWFPMIFNTVADQSKHWPISGPKTESRPQHRGLRKPLSADGGRELLGDVKKLDTNMVALPHPDAMAAMLSGNEDLTHFTNEPFAQFEAEDNRVRRSLSSSAIDLAPASELLAGKVDLHTDGFIKVIPGTTTTSVRGPVCSR
jgi:NitT/TauT family transport system substrate-binding protein